MWLWNYWGQRNHLHAWPHSFPVCCVHLGVGGSLRSPGLSPGSQQCSLPTPDPQQVLSKRCEWACEWAGLWARGHRPPLPGWTHSVWLPFLVSRESCTGSSGPGASWPAFGSAVKFCCLCCLIFLQEDFLAHWKIEQKIEFPGTPCPSLCIAFPVLSVPHQSGMFVTVNDLLWHVRITQSLVYLTVHSRWCTPCGFRQACNWQIPIMLVYRVFPLPLVVWIQVESGQHSESALQPAGMLSLDNI